MVFAEAAGCRPAWKQGLEGWNVRESQQVNEWIAEGKAEGRAEGEAQGKQKSLLRLLALRFPPGAPEEVAAVIRATTDPEQLDRWFDVAVAAGSLDAFRQGVQP